MWEALPEELQLHIVRVSMAVVVDVHHTDGLWARGRSNLQAPSHCALAAKIGRLRCTSKVFAESYWPLMLMLSPHRGAESQVEGFVETMHRVLLVRKQGPKRSLCNQRMSGLASFGYSLAYHYCTLHAKFNMSNNLYLALGEVVPRMCRERGWDAEHRDQIVRSMSFVFSYLNRFYVKNCALAPVLEHMSVSCG